MIKFSNKEKDYVVLHNLRIDLVQAHNKLHNAKFRDKINEFLPTIEKFLKELESETYSLDKGEK